MAEDQGSEELRFESITAGKQRFGHKVSHRKRLDDCSATLSSIIDWSISVRTNDKEG